MLRVKFSLAVVVCLFLAGFVQAQVGLKVNEAEVKASVIDNRLQIDLAVENGLQRNLAADVRLEILNAEELILSRSETKEKIARGKNNLQISLGFTETDIEKLLWYRLRYQINANGTTVSGIVALSEILPEIFELRVSASEQIYAGMRFPVRVRAFHPTKDTPISNVKINAELKIDLETDSELDELKIAAAGETDKDGFAVLEFDIPEGVKFSGETGGSVEVKGEKNNLKSVAEDELGTENEQTYLYFITDKPLYQPNQKIYIRSLALRRGRSDSTTVVADKEFEFSITDEDDTVLFRQMAKTSRFGVAAVEWQIPENAKLGSYHITAKDDDNGNGSASFKVSRYELPNFVVQTKPDKEFYLPEQTIAEVSVDALYLFGKPVGKGKVKVVEEGDRQWNYKEQKWNIDEEAVYEGETDEQGKYIAKIDLSKAHASLKEDEDEYFDDLHFAAYFTDFSTNKTEQKRFDLRVTKEPIHVYFIGRRDDDELNPKMPLRFYVSTESANGDPITCDVEIRGKYEDEAETAEKTLATIKTNSLGMGEVELRAPKRESDIYVWDLDLKIIARDSANKTGTRKQEIEMEDEDKQILIRTDKAIYRKGEPVKIEILSTESDETVFVDVSKNWSSIVSRTIKLKNGRAEVRIPYDPNFKSMLIVSAYFEDDGDAVKDSHDIVYPTPKSLRVNATSEKEVFRPNEEATVNFAVSSPDKKNTETALGVVILDKAVEERAKTDTIFGGGYVPDNFQDFRDLAYNKWDEINMKEAVSAELQLYARAKFSYTLFDPNFFDSDYEKRSTYVFLEKTKKQFAPIETALTNRFTGTFEYATDDASLRRILSQNGIDFGALRDPWNNSYKTRFSLDKDSDKIEIESAGANKILGDDDDFTALTLRFAYFTPTGIKIDKAVSDYYQKTGKFVRDTETLREVLRAQDMDLDAMKDRWGEPYKIEFGVSNRNYTIAFRTDADKNYSYDDFVIWTTQTDYFAATEVKIETVLNKFINEKKTFPKDEAEFQAVLKDGGIDFDALRDGWNRPFYIEYEVSSRFADKVKIENVAKFGEKSKETISITPVTREIAVVRVRSLGEDGVKDVNRWNDFVVSTFAGLISEQAKDDDKPKIVMQKAVFANGKSAIYGVITDENAAVIPNANVTIINNETQASTETKTNSDGVYLQTSLVAGKYTVKANSVGFKTSVVTEVKLEAEKLVEVNLTLQVGAVTQLVVVAADVSATIDAADTKIDTNITRAIFADLPSGTQFTALLKIAPNVRPEALSGGFQIDGASASENRYVAEYGRATGGVVNVVTKGGTQKDTPRLREYFPETLLWLPEVITDNNGKAEIKFRLADNITTWKIYAIASNEQGRVGITQKEIKAFQPFFVDLEPPKFLTDGDEIFLPTQVRNYTPAKQKVDVTMASSDWFSFLGPDKQQIEVDQNAAKNAVFGFKAIAPVKDGKQRVTATAETDSDAIEKPVTVRPNGQEIVQTESKLFRASADFEINFPTNALPKTPNAELKIYPNLMAHVTDSVEGLLQRPYGCGEQTISSTYPNLMILKFVKADNFLTKKAKIYLQKGYERLLGYQVADGGFSYWGGKSESDIALTAYALRFLSDAKSFIEVDEDVIENAQNYLLKQQRADGSWTKKYYYDTTEDANRTKLFTSYVARTLAMLKTDKEALDKALTYLKTRNAEIYEPYALALFALAAYDAGDTENARVVAERLRTMARDENGAAYWNLETNTPFYGWGTAGRIETTALVLQVLLREKRQNDDLASRATMFLLKSKDRYGVWYSTQTTINVLDAFLASLTTGRDQTLTVSINGEKLKDFSVSSEQIEPIILDLTGKLTSANRVEVTGSNDSAIMAQIVSKHYIDWRDAEISNQNTNQSRQLRLDYKCDKQSAKIMEEITCAVEAERVGFKGYGMLLAEIGLPPGADVSRESLEKALEADSSLSRYDVLPDRIVLYMWSKAGGTKFNFKFKSRYGINAQTPASIVYDYYNEEAKAMVAPMRFEVK